jgi:hypothetical protein
MAKGKDRPKGMVVRLEKKCAVVKKKIKALMNIRVFSKLRNWKLNFCCDTCFVCFKGLIGD